MLNGRLNIEITSNINVNTIFYKDYNYIMVGEIHVLEDITLAIEDGVVIYIRNGVFEDATIKRSALIFDTGSKLISSDFYLVACNSKNEPETLADNGGLWFVGSRSDVDKDGIKAKYSVKSSNFIANKISAYYLGSTDLEHWIYEPSADQDGITALGCGNNEWNITSIHIELSGDNAFDIVESYITIDEVEVIHPGEDAINIKSGQINVLKKLRCIVTLTDVYDRDIFDFENDYAFPYIRIAQYAFVEILGIFGDQTSMVSSDLPQPNGDNLYYFKGICTNGQTYIWAGFRKPVV